MMEMFAERILKVEQQNESQLEYKYEYQRIQTESEKRIKMTNSTEIEYNPM